VRTLADINEASRVAWETVGHRGGVLDALRMCLQYTAPLPDWLAPVVEEAVTWWTRKAPTGKKKGGRHANFAVERRAIVTHLQRDEFYRNQVERGYPPTQAQAMAAEWFRVDENTIRDSLILVKQMPPGKRYLALDDRVQLHAWLRQPNAKAEIHRWGELERRYAPWRKPTPPKPI
jgi:hypothetical protein